MLETWQSLFGGCFNAQLVESFALQVTTPTFPPQGFETSCRSRQRFIGRGVPELAEYLFHTLQQNFLQILKRAGVASWPRLFHNLRSSAQTDLANRFPTHVICDWLGNTEAIAMQHYLQVTPEHMTSAANGESSLEKALPKALPALRLAALNAAQTGVRTTPRNEKTPYF